MDLSPVTTTKIYFPFLLQKGITDIDELESMKIELADASKRLVNDKIITTFDNVSLFYDIYDERTSELDYIESGIGYVNFIIHPPFKFNLPLDTIFKLVHATQNTPLIKYNPGPRQEKIYKLYTDQIAKNGKKIPYLSKGTIFKLMRTIGRTKKVSVYTEHLYQDQNIPIICDFADDGTIQVTAEFRKAYPRAVCEEIMRNSVNPVIETVKDFLEQSGYEISLFNDFILPNIEVLSMGYSARLPITKNIHVDRYMGCLSSIFNVLETQLSSGIIMRYKRVANYNEMDNITAFMTEKLKIGLHDAELIESLIQNFSITAEEARQRLVDLLNEFQVEQGLYENKRLRIRNNPGFPVKITQDKFKSVIFIEVDNIDDVYYLDTIPVYLDSLIRITQDISSTNVPRQTISEICKRQVQKDVELIEDIVAPAEHPLESNFNPAIVAEELQFEQTPLADSDNIDDLLDFMGDDDDVEEELSQALSAEKGSPSESVEDVITDSDSQGAIPSGTDVLPKSMVAEVSVPVSRKSDNTGSLVGDLLSQTLRIGDSSKEGGAGTSSSPESVVDDDWMDDILDFVPPSDTKEDASSSESLDDIITKQGKPALEIADASVSSSDDIIQNPSGTTPIQQPESEKESLEEEEEKAEQDQSETESKKVESEREVSQAEESEETLSKEEAESEKQLSNETKSVTESDKSISNPSDKYVLPKSSTPDKPFIEPAPGIPESLKSEGIVRQIPIIDEETSSGSSAASIPQPTQPVLTDKKSTSQSESSDEKPIIESLESGSEIIGQDIEELVTKLSDKAESDAKTAEKDVETVESDAKDDEDDLVRNIDGMSLSNPNPVFTRLHDNDPTLFLTQDVGKFKQYSRACPWNVRRQPILLTEKEKENIDRNHPGSYENAIKYGSDPDNQFYYICPRYWCLLNNTSLTEEDVKQGKCGGQIIPRDAKKVPPGKYILEFNHPSEHIDEEGNYIPHHPGFLKNPNPDGKCIPCCFKNWGAPSSRNEEKNVLAIKVNAYNEFHHRKK